MKSEFHDPDHPSYHLPARIGVELSSSCNMECLHCLREKGESGSLPPRVYASILEQAKPYRIPLVVLTGGEPTLHPDLDQILETTVKQGYRFAIVTNGWNFPEIYPLFLSFREHLRVVTFSLDGADRETHDRIRRDGSFDHVMASLGICKVKQIPFNIQMTVHSLNRPDMENLAILGARLGASNVSFVHAQPSPGAFSFLLSPAEWREVEEEASRISKILKTPVGLGMGSFRQSLWNTCPSLSMEILNFDWRGNLTFCCQLSGYGPSNGKDIIGNIRDHSFQRLHETLIEAVSVFQKVKSKAAARGELTHRDHFPCWFCFRYFEKLEPCDELEEKGWKFTDPKLQRGKTIED